MTNRHTPGPWTWSAMAGEAPTVHTIHGGEVRSVCDMVDNMDADFANANLIAAAPELLEALEWLQAAALAYGLDENKQCIEPLNNATKAIKKAKGE